MNFSKYLIYWSLSLMILDAYGMRTGRFANNFQFRPEEAQEAARAAERMINNLAERREERATEARQRVENRERDRQNRLARRDRELTAARSEAERLAIHQAYNDEMTASRAVDAREANSNATWEQVGANFANVVPQAYTTAFGMLRAEQDAEYRLRETAISADQNRKAAITKHKATLAALTNTQNLKKGVAALSVLALGVSLAWQGSKLLTDVIRHIYRNPTLAQETSLLSFSEKCKRFFFGGSSQETKVSDVILEPGLAKRIDLLAKSVKNTVANGAYFRNILFYGPPGTGKTMLAQRIARSSGLDYIYFAASSLDQFSIEEATIKLTELFEFAKKSSKKLMIIIDEAEVLFANRDKELSEKARKMLTHLLTYTGTESKDYLLVLLTNRPQDLDEAVYSRCDERIEIGAPGPVERRAILEKYINEHLINAKNNEPKPSFFGNLFTTPKTKKLIIEDGVFSPEAIDKINAKLTNFVGRDVSKLVLAIAATAYATPDATITKDMVDTVVTIKIAEKQKTTDGFSGYGKKGK